MTEKHEISINECHRIINAGPLILVSAMFEIKKTVSTIAWQMPVSSVPKLIAISLANKRFTLELIKESKSFTINIPEYNLLEKVVYCGTNSGRTIDKFTEAGLTAVKCRKINSIYIDECSAHIECSLFDLIQSGDHIIVIGKVEDAYTNKNFFNLNGVIDIQKVKLIHHLGGKDFATLSL